ncbi:MAG: hypothetical protein QNJ55_26295 [Xenococcus sp. MO_188.B8]|nr:hypothetical protein [Xenococcus sp. MO_188.B8]
MLHLIFCIVLWSIIGSLIIWGIFKKTKQGINYVKKLHQIPCSNCVYFTGDYRLKCTVDPIKAMTENALACKDFASKSDYSINNQVTSIKK